MPVVLANDETRLIAQAINSASESRKPGIKQVLDQAHKEAAKPNAVPEETERIMRSLLSAAAPVDIRSLTKLTSIATRKLSWRLLCLVQHGQISRKKEHQAKSGERYNYYLSGTQRDAALKVWGQGPDAPMPEGNAQIMRALYSSDCDLDIADLAEKTGIAHTELSWRLARMTRQDQIARRKSSKTAEAFKYFLREDQVTLSASWCQGLPARVVRGENLEHNADLSEHENDDDQSDAVIIELLNQLSKSERELQFARHRKTELQRELANIKSKMHQDSESIQSMEREMAQERIKAQNVANEKAKITSIHAKALAKAQMNPMALSERLAFIQKLRQRPALESLAALREIERDYQQALSIARGA